MFDRCLFWMIVPYTLLIVVLFGTIPRVQASEFEKCPPELSRCICGMGYYPPNAIRSIAQKRYIVNCTDLGLTSAAGLKALPARTEVLIFTGNIIPSLPFNIIGNFSTFPHLEVVDLSNNHISYVPGKTFHKVSNVKMLILNHNHLDIVDSASHPRVFSNFDNLVSLHLTNAFSEDRNSSDYLFSLDDIFYESDLLHLQKLHLEQNEIWTIGEDPKIFCQLSSLEHLYLGDNRLTDIDFNFDCIPKLSYIDIERNNIRSLSQDTISKLEKLSRQGRELTLDLLDNPFLCDCSSEPFLMWMHNTNIKLRDREDYRCFDGLPDSNTGKKLDQVQDLLCFDHERDKASAAAIAGLAFFVAFLSSLLLAVAFFHRERLKLLMTPYWDYLTRKIGYTGIAPEEAPKEVNV
ncbi:toll-like receptor 4 isoform X2 [Oratosquilla oratoria]|uniref:toll-like receptor 4 isoform X2 n=1 Tax=Oratosquilla oratoria TaxID=337810 RepID=UPI003F76DC2D